MNILETEGKYRPTEVWEAQPSHSEDLRSCKAHHTISNSAQFHRFCQDKTWVLPVVETPLRHPRTFGFACYPCGLSGQWTCSAVNKYKHLTHLAIKPYDQHVCCMPIKVNIHVQDLLTNWRWHFYIARYLDWSPVPSSPLYRLYGYVSLWTVRSAASLVWDGV